MAKRRARYQLQADGRLTVHPDLRRQFQAGQRFVQELQGNGILLRPVKATQRRRIK
jgi:hypothetical protein